MSSRRRPPDTDDMISLKVDNLQYRTTVDDLRRAFEKYGDVGDVYIPRDRFTNESRGFAFVRYLDRNDAEDALDQMDGKMFDGRELRVALARYGRPSNRGYGRPRGGRSGYGGYGGGGYGGRRRYRSRSRSRSRSRRSRSHSRDRRRGRRSRTRSRSNSYSRSRSRSGSRSKSPERSRSKSRSRSPDENEEDGYQRLTT